MKGTKFFGLLALAACLVAPSLAGAACPTKLTYEFNGSGVTTYLLTPGVFTSNWPAASTGLPGIPVNFNGFFTTSNGVSCAAGCLTTATATGEATQNAYTASTNIPNVAGGGFDGISCDTTFSITIAANCVGFPVNGGDAIDTSILATSTTLTATPHAGSTTPAAVCAGLIGSTLDTTTQQSNLGKTFVAVVTHNVGCTNATVPCTAPQDQYTDVVSFNGDSNKNTTF